MEGIPELREEITFEWIEKVRRRHVSLLVSFASISAFCGANSINHTPAETAEQIEMGRLIQRFAQRFGWNEIEKLKAFREAGDIVYELATEHDFFGPR